MKENIMRLSKTKTKQFVIITETICSLHIAFNKTYVLAKFLQCCLLC